VAFVQLFNRSRRDKEVVSVFVRFRARCQYQNIQSATFCASLRRHAASVVRPATMPTMRHRL
jgi:hypothetical protein